jgi:hypothetical protein
LISSTEQTNPHNNKVEVFSVEQVQPSQQTPQVVVFMVQVVTVTR